MVNCLHFQVRGRSLGSAGQAALGPRQVLPLRQVQLTAQVSAPGGGGAGQAPRQREQLGV